MRISNFLKKSAVTLIIAVVAFTGCEKEDGVWYLSNSYGCIAEIMVADGTGTITKIYDIAGQNPMSTWVSAVKNRIVTRGTAYFRNLQAAGSGGWTCNQMAILYNSVSEATGISYEPSTVTQNADGLSFAFTTHPELRSGWLIKGQCSNELVKYEDGYPDPVAIRIVEGTLTGECAGWSEVSASYIGSTTPAATAPLNGGKFALELPTPAADELKSLQEVFNMIYGAGGVSLPANINATAVNLYVRSGSQSAEMMASGSTADGGWYLLQTFLYVDEQCEDKFGIQVHRWNLQLKKGWNALTAVNFVEADIDGTYYEVSSGSVPAGAEWTAFANQPAALTISSGNIKGFSQQDTKAVCVKYDNTTWWYHFLQETAPVAAAGTFTITFPKPEAVHLDKLLNLTFHGYGENEWRSLSVSDWNAKGVVAEIHSLDNQNNSRYMSYFGTDSNVAYYVYMDRDVDITGRLWMRAFYINYDWHLKKGWNVLLQKSLGDERLHTNGVFPAGGEWWI